MKIFTPRWGFETTEGGQKVRYEAGTEYRLRDSLADHYAGKGLGTAVSDKPRFPDEAEEEGDET